MIIEDEIHQSKFKNQYIKGLINLLYTQSYIEKNQKRFFDQYDLTYQQYNILRILRGQYPKLVSLTVVKDRVIDKMSDVSRLVERLRVKGLVNREVCELDKRKVEISISQKGLLLLSQIDPQITVIENLLSKLDSNEIQYFNKILDKIRS